MEGAARAIVSVIAAAFGLATLSVILSQRSQTSSVIGAGGQALAGVISAATSPVTGQGGVTLGSTIGGGFGSNFGGGFGSGLGSLGGGLLGNYVGGYSGDGGGYGLG